MVEYANKHLNKKASEKKTQVKRELIAFNRQDIKKLTKTAKQVVQEYARLRDIDEPCISCRKPTAKQWDGGHFMNAEFHSMVRFNLWNINKQCAGCNGFDSQHLTNYRIHLIDKIGLVKVEWLEQQKGVQKYTAEYLNRLIKIFRKKVRVLKKRVEK